MVLTLLCVIAATDSGYAEEFWVIPFVPEKGRHRLYLVDLKGRVPPYREIECCEQLPRCIQEMVRVAERIDSNLLVRVDVRITQPVVGGELAELQGIKMAVIAPASSYVALQRLGELRENLPNENVSEEPNDPLRPEYNLDAVIPSEAEDTHTSGPGEKDGDQGDVGKGLRLFLKHGLPDSCFQSDEPSERDSEEHARSSEATTPAQDDDSVSPTPKSVPQKALFNLNVTLFRIEIIRNQDQSEDKQ